MNNLDKQYQALLKDIISNGTTKKDRTGTGTISVFGRQITHKMSEGFPLLTTKKMAFKSIVTELIWFLRGDTNIKYLVDNDCNIWNGDAYKKFDTHIMDEWEAGHINELFEDGYIIEELKKPEITSYRTLLLKEFIDKIKNDDKFSKEWGNLGNIYGAQWRNWRNIYYDNLGGTFSSGWRQGSIDQIGEVIKLLHTNPDSRRIMVNAWNVGELDGMTLPPCHYGFQLYTREASVIEREIWYNKSMSDDKYESHFPNMSDDEVTVELDKLGVPQRHISLSWNQRSVDTPLGLPFNIASYGLLLEIIAKEVNMVPDELKGNLGDTHIYLNQLEGVEEQISRNIMHTLPKIQFNRELDSFDSLICDANNINLNNKDIMLMNYLSDSKIHFPLSN